MIRSKLITSVIFLIIISSCKNKEHEHQNVCGYTSLYEGVYAGQLHYKNVTPIIDTTYADTFTVQADPTGDNSCRIKINGSYLGLIDPSAVFVICNSYYPVAGGSFWGDSLRVEFKSLYYYGTYKQTQVFKGKRL